MTSSGLVVAYHRTSSQPLPVSDEMELLEALARHDLQATIASATRPSTLPAASILDTTAVILVITGTLASKALLDAIVKDLYAFFKGKYFAKEPKLQSPSKYAIVLEVTCEGAHYNVGIDFNDEATLTIGFYRLHIHTQALPVSKDLVE